MSIVFATFVYPKAQDFFSNFIHSLEQQTNSDFKLVIFNDGCSEKELKIFEETKLNIQIVDNHCHSIAHNRFNAIQWLYNSQYDFIIFGDIDDTFATNRVEILNRGLKKYPIIINELNLCNKRYEILKKDLVSSYLIDNKIINKLMIKEFNLIGFSHLAIQRSALKYLKEIQIDESLKIVDWLFATYLLEHEEIYFEDSTFTNYIYHEDNIALNNNQTAADYIFTLETKIQHYSQVILLDDWYKSELEALQKLKSLIEYDPVIAIRFETYMKKKEQEYYPWWKQIKNSKELEREICI